MQTVETDHNNQMDSFGISISKQSTHLQLDSEFLWYQRILALLANNNARKNTKKDLINSFRKEFGGNRPNEGKLQVFENT